MFGGDIKYKSLLAGYPEEYLPGEGFWKRKGRWILAALGILGGIWVLAYSFHIRAQEMNLEADRKAATPSPSTAEAAEATVELPTNKLLITYAYFETPNARQNAEFFIKHGIHDGADFIFILNGETNLYELLPDVPYVKYIKRNNECFDLGSTAQVLLRNKGELVKKYERFIMLNASIRGPFVPVYSSACWSDAYAGRLNERVRLVGMTYNCKKAHDVTPHVSSMLWAVDRIALEILLQNGMNTCFNEKGSAIGLEIGSATYIKEAGYAVEAMFAAFHSSPDFQETCNFDDPNHENAYYGTSIHPFETMFVKANRNVAENVLELYTSWIDGRKYDSHEFCGSKRAPGRLTTVGEALVRETEKILDDKVGADGR